MEPKHTKANVKYAPVHAMKAHEEAELYYIQTLSLDVNEWSASRPSRFNLEERAPGTYRLES
jgi:hypothetical protein